MTIIENLKTTISRILLRGKAKSKNNQFVTWAPPGHFYSTIPDLNEITAIEVKIWGIPKGIKGVDLNSEAQLRLLNTLSEYYKDLPFDDLKKPNLRYYYKNGFFLYSDAIFLYSMIRHLKPKKIIEVGSGFSSMVTLDTNELFCDNTIDCTFIEPYPDNFLSLIKESDRERVKLVVSNLQEIDLGIFEKLEPNDILFIDSTHVAKIGSDVNYIFFEILPSLNKGVYIHFHDIFYPFQYPKEWVYEGRAWNEVYLLRAFLQYNTEFQIVIFNTYLHHAYKDILTERMPLCLKNPGGSIWIKKV